MKKHTGLWALAVLSLAAGFACYCLGNQKKAQKQELDAEDVADTEAQAEAGVDSQTETYVYNGLTRKIHRPDCPNCPDKKNQVYFGSKADALKAGYTPCRVCNP